MLRSADSTDNMNPYTGVIYSYSLRPGVGKINLAVSIGIEAAKQRYSVYFISFHEMMTQLKQARHENRLEVKIKWFCRYKLLIIDEVGYEKMNPDTANLFFNLISKRYEKTSTIITTNLIFSKWQMFLASRYWSMPYWIVYCTTVL